MDYYVGEIRIFAGTYSPRGWHFCDGSMLQITEYPALFSLLGTVYGGDGRVTFQLPNMHSRVAVGTGKLLGGINTYVLGQTGGKTEVMLTTSNIPAHSHTLKAYTGDASTADPSGNKALAASLPGGAGYESVKFYASLPSGVTEPDSQLDERAVAVAGYGLAHQNMMPCITVNYIIALNGTYPPNNS